MDAIQILNDARAQWYTVAKAKEILATAQASISLQGIKYHAGKVQNGPTDPTATKAERIRQAEQDLLRAAERLATLQRQAQRMIDTLENCPQRLVLELHYLALPPLSMTKTAEQLEISRRTAYRLRDAALEALEAQEVRRTADPTAGERETQ